MYDSLYNLITLFQNEIKIPIYNALNNTKLLTAFLHSVNRFLCFLLNVDYTVLISAEIISDIITVILIIKMIKLVINIFIAIYKEINNALAFSNFKKHYKKRGYK